KSQGARTKALADFKQGKVKALIATDIAARGLDIDQLPQVVNFDLPNVAEDYVHRIGRTGRAGGKGQAISMVTQDEFKELVDIEILTKQLIQRKVIAGYEPSQPLPESKEGQRPIKAKKKPQPNRQNNQSNRNRTGDSRNNNGQPSQRRRKNPANNTSGNR
ncbi:MAG: helicase-related protein, partial [Paraglaciecola sp.]|uniref:helicase-related protein n=1 Tax=Paraglaciecola sp. TaxID=1920173 RepID=UPI0032974392